MDKSSVVFSHSTGTRRSGATGLAYQSSGDSTFPTPISQHPPEEERAALHFWRRMALTAAPGDTPKPRTMALPAELYPALRLFEAGARGSRHGGVSAPSAGALYPYEHAVVTGHPDGPRVFAVDVARRSVQLVACPQPAAGYGDLPVPLPGESLVLTVVRPWLSMRKYGDRGYLYAHVDAAHLSTHLYCLAGPLFARTSWLEAPDSRPLDTLLGLPGRCRFVHSALWLRHPVDPAVPPRDEWRCSDHRQPCPAPPPPGTAEQQAWQRLPQQRHRPSTVPARATADPDDGAPGPEIVARAAARRRSAKDFTAAPVAAPVVRKALAALATRLPLHPAPVGPIGVTLVARDVTGLAAGAYRVHGGTVAAAPAAHGRADGDELVRVCMGQEHLRNAGAAVVFHGRHRDIFRLGIGGVDAALLRVGALAHLLYLGAAATDLAVTTIGGFDAAGWHQLGALPPDDEVLYVALLGAGSSAAVKVDRLQPAYAHGEA